MPIQAQLADGRTLEFPDGTEQSVIQATVKRLISEGAEAPTAAPEPQPSVAQTAARGMAEMRGYGTPKKTESVLEGAQMPVEQEVRMGVNPEFIRAVQAQLDAMPADKREAALAEMVKREDVYGRAARTVAERYGKIEKMQAPTAKKLADRRLEAGTERFIEQGLGAESAKQYAEQQALQGFATPEFAQATADVVGERAATEAAKQAEELKDAGFLERTGALAKSRATQTGLGLMQIYADATGDKGLSGRISDVARIEESRQEAIPKGEGVFEKSAQQAMASLATQLPITLLSAMTGSPALALAQAGIDVFGNEYGNARQKGLTPQEASLRAGLLASAEVTFERFGLTEEIKALRGILDKTPTDQIAGFLAKALAKELPAEQFTSATQFLVDKLPQIGLNRNAGWKEFWENQAETLRQTILQSGAQSAGTIAAAKGVKALAGALPEPKERYQRDEIQPLLYEMAAREKGFLVPEAKPEAEPPAKPSVKTPTPTEAAPTPEAKAALPDIESLTREIMDTTGMDEADARARAQRRLELESELLGQVTPQAPTNRVEELTQEFIDAGVPPQEAQQRAVTQAQEEQDADSMAERATSGEQPIAGADRTGVPVAGQPAAEPTPAGVGGAEPTGVVPTEQVAGGAGAGEGEQPAPVKGTKPANSALPKKFLHGTTPENKAAILESGKFLPGDKRQYSYSQFGRNAVYFSPEEGWWLNKEAAQNGRAAVYPETVEAKLDPKAQIAVINSVADLDALAKKVGYADGVELMRRLDVDGLDAIEYMRNARNMSLDEFKQFYLRDRVSSAPEEVAAKVSSFEDLAKEYEELGFPHVTAEGLERSAERTWEDAQKYEDVFKVADEATQKLLDAGVDGIYIAKGFADSLPEEAGLGSYYPAQEQLAMFNHERIKPAGKPAGKRGRPALSPEQKEAADAARKQQRLAANQAKRNVDKAEALLTKSQEPIDEAAYDNDEAVAAAQDEQLTNQRAAIRTLYQISRENKGKPGQRATEVLKGVKNQRLVQDAKAAYEYQKTGRISRSDQGAAAVEAADEGFNKATNGAQALNLVAKTGNDFQKFLARRLRNFVVGVKVVVIEQGDALPEQLTSEKNAKHWERARGLYIENPQTRARTVYLRGASFGEDQGVNNVTVLHELLHAATNVKLGQALQAIQNGYSTDSKLVGVYRDLLRTMNSAGRRFNELAAAGKLPKHISNLARYGNLFEDPKEFVAYGMSDPAFQEFLMGAKGFEEDTSFFTRFVDSVRRFFNMGDDTVNALSDLMVVTDKLLSTRMTPTMRLAEYGMPEQVSPAIKLADEEKKAARSAQEIDTDVKEAIKKVNASRTAEELGKAIGVLHAVKDPSKILPLVKLGYDSATYKGRQAMAAVPSFDFLARWTKDTIPELSNTNVLLEKMSGMSHQLLAKVGEVSEDVVRAYRKDRSLRKKLEDVVYTSTLAQVDPADTAATTRNPTLDAMYTALGAEGQRIYKRLRDYYKNMTEYYSDLLDQQLQQLDVDPDTKTNLLRVVRTIYEGKEKISPYFPLVREGDYWLRIGSGANKQFFLYGTKAARDNAARELAAQRKGDLKELLDRGKFAIGDDVGTLREASRDSSAMLTQIFDAIDAANMADPDVVSSLKDAIYQVYLTTMPEQTFRNSFIHRKGITGFRTDLLQNINTTGARMSVQLSRIKYAPLLRNSISQAESSIVGRNELEPFIASARNRVRAALTAGRKGDSVDQVMEAIAGTANKASFLWYLSGASSALIQPFSVYITGLPILTAQHGAGAAKELAKMVAYMNQYGIVRQNADGTRSYVAPSLANNPNLSEDERRAVREMLTRGVTQSSYASEVFGYKSVPSETLYFDSTRGVIDNIPVALGKGRRFAHVLIGGLMHNTERLSREAIYLASYRLSRNAGKSHEQAVDQAVIDTNEALGNYDVTNRPVAMQKGLGKILLQFKMFPLHTASLLLTNFKRMLPLLNKEGKREAAIKFFGIYGTAASVAGLVGVPGFSAVMGMLGWAWKEFGKDDDWPEDLKSLDFETWFRTVFLPKELGDWAKLVETGPLNQLTGMDLASRLSLNNLWGRDTKETKTTREGVIAAAMSNAGPTASMVLSLADAYDAWKLGDTRKAVEKAAPAVLRNGAVFDRLRKEGAKDYRGAELISKDAFTTGELVGQLIGFRPALLADVQDKNFKLMGIENRITNKRNEILTRLDVAYRNKDMGKYRDAFAAMNDFNKAFPSYEIDADTLAKSLEGKQEQRGKAYVGIVPTEKNVPIIGEALVQSRKAVREREAEARKK